MAWQQARMHQVKSFLHLLCNKHIRQAPEVQASYAEALQFVPLQCRNVHMREAAQTHPPSRQFVSPTCRRN